MECINKKEYNNMDDSQAILSGKKPGTKRTY